MIRLCWRVVHKQAGRYVTCEGKEDGACLFFAIGFVPWEHRGDYRSLIQAVHTQALICHIEWIDKVLIQVEKEGNEA